MKTRFFSLALAALMSLSLLVSCATDPAEGPDSSADTTTAPADTSAADTTTADPNDRSHVKDSVPDDVMFEGETVRILYRGSDDGKGKIEIYDVRGTDNVGDYVSDGVWERNRKIEDRFGITLSITATNTGDLSSTATMIKNLVMSASDEYDYLNTTGNVTVTSALNAYLRDLSNLPYVDYDQPWWWKQTIRDISIDGKTYNYIFSDAMIYCYIQTGAVYYNKPLFEANFGDPDAMYQEVLNGTWTIDRLSELAAGAYKDENGDGSENTGDIFGALKTQTQGEEVRHFIQGFDIEMYHYDENDRLVIEFDQERSVTAIDKLSNFFNNTVGVMHSDVGLDPSDKYFAEGSVLFYPSRLSRATFDNLRNMEDPYGILPYPKLDAEQKEYISLIHDSSTNICVMRSIPDSRMQLIGATLEALSAESYRSVMPLFLETAMKLKYSRDELSGQVIDIIVESVTKNPLMEYKDWTSNIVETCLLNPAKSGNNNFSSAYKKVASVAQNKWNKAIDSLGE